MGFNSGFKGLTESSLVKKVIHWRTAKKYLHVHCIRPNSTHAISQKDIGNVCDTNSFGLAAYYPISAKRVVPVLLNIRTHGRKGQYCPA